MYLENVLKITIATKLKGQNIGAADEFLLPLQVISKQGDTGKLVFDIQLCQTTELKKVLNAINSHIEDFEFIQINIDDREPIYIEP